MEPLSLFSHTHIGRLRVGVKDHLARYRRSKPWADRPVRGEPASFPSGVVPAAPFDFVIPTSPRHLFDFENAVRMHRALPHLTREQASDPRLWVRLTHVEGWEYMRRRWDVRPKIREDKNPVGYVTEHYFVASSSPSRALTRNGMSRLWWYAHLTHDPKRAEPYELTRVLLSALDIAQQLLERNLGRAPHVRTGFLEHIRDHDAALGTGGDRRDRIRALSERLNLTGGVTLLDALSVGQVRAVLND